MKDPSELMEELESAVDDAKADRRPKQRSDYHNPNQRKRPKLSRKERRKRKRQRRSR